MDQGCSRYCAGSEDLCNTQFHVKVLAVRDVLQGIEQTVFACLEGLFEFVKMPFGLRNTPVTLQPALDLLMMGLI